jgi:hypothetical protein
MTDPKVPDPTTSQMNQLEELRERLKSDRRESPRVPMRFLVRDVDEGGSFADAEGDLAVGGIHWRGRYPPVGKKFEVRFRLPGVDKEIRTKAEVIRARDEGKELHLKFSQLDFHSELAIAKFLDDYKPAR